MSSNNVASCKTGDNQRHDQRIHNVRIDYSVRQADHEDMNVPGESSSEAENRDDRTTVNHNTLRSGGRKLGHERQRRWFEGCYSYKRNRQAAHVLSDTEDPIVRMIGFVGCSVEDTANVDHQVNEADIVYHDTQSNQGDDDRSLDYASLVVASRNAFHNVVDGKNRG